MHDLIFENGHFLSVGEAPLFTASEATLYGRGVFTTVAIHNAEPFLWKKHWRRLTENAAKLAINISDYDERSVANALAELIKGNQVSAGRARITFSDESPSEVWSNHGEKKTGLSIITSGPRTIPDNFKLTVSPHRINTKSPLAGVKSCNYLEHLMAFEDAKSRRFDEAIRLNERGEVASGCMSNIFWTNGEKRFTPSLKTGCLAGTTRVFVLENLECEEVEFGIDALIQANGIFLTSAGIGVVQVSELDGRSLERADHPFMELLPKQAEPPA
jgi:branched-subunit amino acid aminotransferase/4-amino-4-deoxychorismate lyase